MSNASPLTLLLPFPLLPALFRYDVDVPQIPLRRATVSIVSSENEPQKLPAVRTYSGSFVKQDTVGYHKHKHKDKERRSPNQVRKVSASLDDLYDHHGNTATPEGNGMLLHACNTLKPLVSQEEGAPASPPSSQELSTTSKEKGSHVDHSPLTSALLSDGRISSPVLCKGLVSPKSANLHNMVLPIPESWVHCGYLWLRIKLFNNRYEWICMVSRLCTVCVGV